MFGMGLLWYGSYDVTTFLKTLLAFKGTNPISKSLFWRDFEDMRQISSNVHYLPAFSNQVSPRFSCYFGPLSWGQVDGDRHGIGEVWKLGSFFGFVSQRLSDSSSLGKRSDRKEVKDLVVSCVHGRAWLLFQNISLKSESLIKTFLKYLFQWDCRSFTPSDAEDLWEKNSWRMLIERSALETGRIWNHFTSFHQLTSRWCWGDGN